jgi:hypothetical protein
MQVVINTKQFGTFSISKKAIEYIQKKIKLKKDKQSISCYAFDCDRSNPLLIEAVKKFKNEANGLYCELKIVEIPDDIEWQVFAVNGVEVIREKHRVWM